MRRGSRARCEVQEGSRRLRSLLLFGLLGMATTLAVAWGLSLPWYVNRVTGRSTGVGVGAAGGIVVRVEVSRYPGGRREWWTLTDSSIHRWPLWPRVGDAQRIREIGGAAYDEEVERIQQLQAQIAGTALPPSPPGVYRVDELAERGAPIRVDHLAGAETELLIETAGWPLRAMRGVVRSRSAFEVDGSSVGWRFGDRTSSSPTTLEVPWPPPGMSGLGGSVRAIRLPLEPLPGFAANAIFFALTWWALLLGPRLIRRRYWRSRGRCAWCGYSLRGQPSPGCPECGQGRSEGDR